MSSSPPELRVRPARLEDAEAVRELIAAFDERHSGEADVTADDLRDEWRRVDLEHDSRAPRLKLRYPDFLQEPVIHVEALAHQRGSQLRPAQIEENPVGIPDALGTKPDLAF